MSVLYSKIFCCSLGDYKQRTCLYGYNGAVRTENFVILNLGKIACKLYKFSSTGPQKSCYYNLWIGNYLSEAMK